MSLFDGVQKDIRGRQRQNVDRANGFLPTTIHTIARRFMDVNVPDRTKLPSYSGNLDAQDQITGEFYFLLDYSLLDGPDILA